tara:strand:+ start:21 stop:539 length:519 start_codon:yes stop_codon:yes gene_type:complete
MNRKFQQSLTRDGSIIIEIMLANNIENVDINTFIKNYKISNFWKGKFFIKRLINKIFRHQLNQKIIWDKRFWNKIKISRIKTYINMEDYKKVKLNIQAKTEFNRYSDIDYYQDLISKNHYMGDPLYISGDCMNYLGAKIVSDNIYILDGSRRLIAHIMNNISPQILLIELND